MTAIVGNFFNGITWMQLIAKAIVIFCCIPIHECAHAWVALKLGDHTAERYGRVTLNPFAHLDPWGTIMILAFGVGYAKPVPVTSYNFRKPKLDMAWVAVAGPLSNLVMAICFLLIGKINYLVDGTGGTYANISMTVMSFMRFAAYININLAVFNLIPIPPLDGSRVLMALVPDGVYYRLERLERYSVYLILGLILILNLLGITPVAALSGRLFNALDVVFG